MAGILDTGDPGSLFHPRKDIGGGKGELGGITSLAKNAMYERWWRKELEDFDRVAVPKMKEAVTKLGEMANDENFTDHGGAWSMMKSAVMSVKNEALKYPNNPYISTKSAHMDKALANGFNEMTKGLRDMQQIRTSRAQQKQAEFQRESVLPQQLETEKLKTQIAKGQLKKQSEAEQYKTVFGDLGPNPEGWEPVITSSGKYQTLWSDKVKEEELEAWDGEEGQEYRDEMSVMATVEGFKEQHHISKQKKEKWQKELFTKIVGGMGVAPGFVNSTVATMMKTTIAKDTADKAREPLTPSSPLVPGSAAMNKFLWDMPNLGEGRAVDLRGTISVAKMNKRSIAAKALNEYIRLRNKGELHNDALGAVLADRSIQALITSRLNVSSKTGQLSIPSIMDELEDLLEQEGESHEATATAIQSQRRILETGERPIPAYELYKKIRALGGAKEHAQAATKAAFEFFTGEEVRPETQEFLQKVKSSRSGASPDKVINPRLMPE
jgi:hypothetical protein